jgi:glycosyltransferase involved in cell wall biosynthesis
LLTRSEEVVVLSKYSRSQIEALAPAVAARTTVAPAGVDLQRFHPARDEEHRRLAGSRLGLDGDGGPLLITVRRLVPRMGIEDLLDACAQLAAKGIPFRLAIAGDGEQRPALEQHAADRQLGSRVRFLGRLADEQLSDLYRAAEIFVLPTRSLEGFGMVTAEALASGLMVVATEAGASSEVLAGEGLRREASRAARAHAVEHLTWTGHLDALERAAGRLLERSK